MTWNEPAIISLAAAAFLIGLLIGRMLWGGGGGARDRLAAELDAARATLAERETTIAQQGRDLAAARDQVKPLADEVDKLRRDNARFGTRAPVAEVLPVAVTPHLDDIRLLKGVGDKLADRLRELGVRGNADLAALSSADAAGIDGQLGPFAGRIARDHLQDQARLLADGRVTEFEARYGKLERLVT